MINQFCNNCGTLIGIKVPSIRERHIAIGALDQRKQIEIELVIFGVSEALNFIALFQIMQMFTKLDTGMVLEKKCNTLLKFIIC